MIYAHTSPPLPRRHDGLYPCTQLSNRDSIVKGKEYEREIDLFTRINFSWVTKQKLFFWINTYSYSYLPNLAKKRKKKIGSVWLCFKLLFYLSAHSPIKIFLSQTHSLIQL